MNELVHQLGIDWKLLLAQAVNFFILLYLLKRFAYAPLLSMLEERKNRIEKSLHQAESNEREYTRLRELREDILNEARREAARILQEARTDAEARQAEMLARAKDDALRMRSRAKEEMSRDREEIMHAMKRDIASVVVDAAQKVTETQFKEKSDRVLVERVVGELTR